MQQQIEVCILVLESNKMQVLFWKRKNADIAGRYVLLSHRAGIELFQNRTKGVISI